MAEHVPTEVVAGALHARWKEGACAHVGKWHACRVESRDALRALASDERVRALLVAVMHRCAPLGAAGECFRPCGYLTEAEEYADAILDALNPPSEQGAT